MSSITGLKAIWATPDLGKKSGKAVWSAILQTAYYDAFYNRAALYNEAKRYKQGSSAENKVHRYDPLGVFSSHQDQIRKRKLATALMTICLSPATLGTYLLSIGSEAARYAHANEQSVLSAFCHYCIFAPLRTIWAWTVEPLGKLVIFARDGLFFHAKNGHKLKALMYGMALIAASALSWISLFAAFGVGVGVAITKGLSSINAFKAIGHFWQKTVGAFCKSVMRLCGGVNTSLMKATANTAPFVAAAAAVSHPIDLSVKKRSKRRQSISDFNPASLQEWGKKRKRKKRRGPSCLPFNKKPAKTAQVYQFDPKGGQGIEVTNNPAAGVIRS